MLTQQLQEYNTSYNPDIDLSFFEQLPYDVACYILLFVEKDYDNDICNKIKDPCLINIIKFDEYINSYRIYKKIETITIYAMNYNILRIMSCMSGLAYSS